MTLDRWVVLLGGVAAIGWVLWYFLPAGRTGAGPQARGKSR
jgi:hypothetical protein